MRTVIPCIFLSDLFESVKHSVHLTPFSLTTSTVSVKLMLRQIKDSKNTKITLTSNIS